MALASAHDRTISIPSAALGGGTALGAASHGAVAGIIPRNQRQSEWCWAACLQMVLGKFGITKSQCELANAATGNHECCDSEANASSSLCDQPIQVLQYASEYAKYQVASNLQTQSLSYAAAQQEIASDRPVQVGIQWSFGGHAVLVVGWDDSADGQYLLVNWPTLSPSDPSASGSMLYQELLSPNNSAGTWKWSWTGIHAL